MLSLKFKFYLLFGFSFVLRDSVLCTKANPFSFWLLNRDTRLHEFLRERRNPGSGRNPKVEIKDGK